MISCGVFVSNSSESLAISSAESMKRLYPVRRYNRIMNSNVAMQLIKLNRKFYDQFGGSFSATSQRLQPGVKKILENGLIRMNPYWTWVVAMDFFCARCMTGVTEPRFSAQTFSLPLLQEAQIHAGS